MSKAAGNRIIDRFAENWPSPDTRCLMAMMRNVPPEYVEVFLRLVSNRMNCSVLPIDLSNIGLNIDANGSYDGALGMIQRHEIDGVLYMYRSDYFTVQPGFIATFGLSTDVVITMQKRKYSISTLGLIQLWTSSYDTITVSYVLISIFLFLTTVSFCCSPSLRVSVLIRNMSGNLHRSIFAIIDQENFDDVNTASNAAVLFFNLFLLFAIHGIMFGCMGADLISVTDYPVYESLDEFSNTSSVQPTVFSTLWLPAVFKRISPGSELWPLKHAVEAHRQQNMVMINMESQDSMVTIFTELADEMQTFKRASILPTFLIEFFLKCMHPDA